MSRPMKHSGVEWLGDIPADWKVLSLGAVTETMRNGYVGPTKNLFVDDGIKYIQSLHIKDGRIDFSRHEYYVSEEWANTHPKIKENDVLIVQTGDIGNVGLVTSEYDGCNCHALIIATPRTNLVFPNYLTYYLRSVVGRELLLFYKTGALLPHLNSGKIKFASVVIPPRDEQKRIATFLDDECARIDSVIEKTRVSIEEYKKLKQALITRAVTKGIRPNRTLKDSGIEWLGDIPADWDCKKVKYVATISRGLFNHRPRNDERYYDGKYPFIQTGDVAQATKYITSYSQTLNELGKSVSKEFPKGTLTMTIAANVGDVAILGFDAFFPDSVVGFVPKEESLDVYLYYVFSAMKDEFIQTAIKSTQLNLNIERIKEMFISFPPLEEQKEIAQYLDGKTAAIDSLVAKKNQLVTELESLKKSLIFEYVTGKKEVAQ